jgi:hypothetical protein
MAMTFRVLDRNHSLQAKKLEGHESLYDNLRLRLVLEEGMIVVRTLFPFTSSPISTQLSIQIVEPGIYLLASIRNSPFITMRYLSKYEKGEGLLGTGVRWCAD